MISSPSLKGRSLLTLLDYTPEEISYLLDLAARLKTARKEGRIEPKLLGKSVALLFEKRSTRTRCAFETACAEEGAHPVFLSSQDIQLGGKETIDDTARVLGRMFDAIQFRGFEQDSVEKLAAHSGVPVYNGLTDGFHPTQALADLMTLMEEFGNLDTLKLAYVGDGRNNVARSLAVACAKMGVRLSIAAPEALRPDEGLFTLLANSGGLKTPDVTTDVRAAVSDAHAIYTDVWTSMGEEDKEAERKALLGPYQVDQALMDATGRPESIFLHCLPAVRGNEVVPGVIDGKKSRVWQQAENRKHTIRALLVATLV